jgi:YVTN family beta-propeller protein
VAFSPSGNLAYVANEGSSTVSVISVATNTVIDTITVPHGVYRVAFNPSGTLAYVTNNQDGPSGNTSIINVGTNTVTGVITSNVGWPNGWTGGVYPSGVAFNPNGTTAFIAYHGVCNGADRGNEVVGVINVATDAMIGYISGNGCPNSIAFSPSGNLAYVTLAYAGGAVEVLAISGTTVTNPNNINIGTYPTDSVAFNPSGTLAYVSDGGNATVSVINVATNTVTKNIGVGVSPYGMALNPSGTLAYVSNYVNNTVTVVNVTTGTITNIVGVGTQPGFVAIDPTYNIAYVTNSNSNTVSVISTYP